MDNLVMLFSEEVQNRYKTVLDNIRNASNTFYDSYNSLLEEFFRSNTINHVRGSICNIIHDKMNKDFILNDVKLDLKTYNKVLDIANKLNSHKHKKEKTVDINFVIRYMSLFYDVVYAFAKYNKFTIPAFKESYFIDLYDCDKKDKEDISTLKDKVDYIAKHLDKKQKDEDAYLFRSKVIHCGIYGYESCFSDKKYLTFKLLSIGLAILCFTFLLIGGLTGKNDEGYFLLGLFLFFAYYFFRIIQLIFCGRYVPTKEDGRNNFLYTQMSKDGVPLATKSVKVYHYLINGIFAFLLIGGMRNVWFILGEIAFIATWIIFFKLKKSYYITIMLSDYGAYAYNPIIQKMVKKKEDGSY